MINCIQLLLIGCFYEFAFGNFAETIFFFMELKQEKKEEKVGGNVCSAYNN